MTGDIFIYGGIGTERGEVSFENVQSQLQLPENKAATELILHIISPGGDVFAGEAIYNALLNTGKKITTHIEGTCASIATLIAAAAAASGGTMIMNKTARFMIHNPKVSGLSTAADSRDLRHVANQLDQIKTLLINVYDKKTNIGTEKLWELYDNETWLTAEEAEKMGFIDESVDAIKAVAKIDLNKFINMKREKSLLDRIQNLLTLSKFKNEFTETLQDGTAIIIMSDDESWEGKQVIVQEDGSALPDGDHVLASGKTITVSGGVISAVKEAAAEDKQTEEMDNKIKELEAQLAEAMAAKETATANAKALEAKVVTSEAKALKIENRMLTLEKDFLKLKEEAALPIGDQTPPDKGPAFKNMGTAQVDHMGEMALSHYKSRNIV